MSTTVDLQSLTPLIDMDILVYRCGFAADSEVKRDVEAAGYTGDEVKQLVQETDYLRNCLHIVNSTMDEKILHKLSRNYRGFLSGSGNFREQVATILPYKGNRDPTHKPKYYKEIKHHLIDKYGAEVIHGREADDALGTAQWEGKGRSTIIVSTDKDLDMIPGYHYNWVKDRFYSRSIGKANLQLFWQMLEGDRTDNIPGIKGVGPKTIQSLFDACEWDIDRIRQEVQRYYRDQYGESWSHAYEEVATLLWIERVEGEGCPFLWS